MVVQESKATSQRLDDPLPPCSDKCTQCADVCDIVVSYVLGISIVARYLIHLHRHANATTHASIRSSAESRRKIYKLQLSLAALGRK